MAYLSALSFLARQEELGLFLYGASLVVVFMGCKTQSICLKKNKKIAMVILSISLIGWIYGELRASGFIIYPDDQQFFLHGQEHENHGMVLSFIFASYSIGSMIGLIHYCWKQRKIRKEKENV